MSKLVENKVVVITGGSRGLGRAIAIEAAKHGAKVAFTYARDDGSASETADQVRALGAQVRTYKGSVLDAVGTDKILRDVESTLGPIDVLINNAGVTQNLPLAMIEEEDFDHVMDINVKGTFLTSRAAARGMIRRKRGVILNLGSLAGMRSLEAPIHYCASKAAIVGMTQAMAKELSRHNIRVLCMAPGLLEGGVGVNLPEHRLADYVKHCALGRVGTFEEVAALAMFLVSDRASYMVGETVVIDGGV